MFRSKRGPCSAHTILLSAAFVFGAVVDSGAAGPLRRQGRTIVNDDGPIVLKGFNVGNWLVQEGYLMHIDVAGYKSPSELRAKVADLVGGQAKAEEFFTAWRERFFQEEDVKALKAAGGNSFRIPFHYKDVFDPATRAPKPAGFRYLDSCLAWGRRHDVYMILDMHVAPGGQNPMEHSDVPAEPAKLFAGTAGDFTFYSEMAAQVWKAVADRYQGESHVAYDLINEPLVTDPAQHWRLEQAHRRITDSIRKVDKVHLVIAEGNWWGSWLQPLGARWDENMAFSTHNYWAKVPDVKRSGQVDWSVAQNVPIWHGETGENSNVWYNIERRDLEAKGIGWSWWTWKKIEGVSGAYTTPTTPGGYLKVLEYWRGQGPKPDPETALGAFLELAAAVDIANCRKNHDVFDALFRPDHHLKAVPYAGVARDVPDDPNTSATRIRAPEYDMGTQGVAYSDSAFMTVSNHKDSSVQWNQGWTWRNDGVDVFTDWSVWEGYIGATSPGEWVNYTVNVLQPGRYRLDFTLSTPEAGRRLQLEVDGVARGGDIAVTATEGWTTWADQVGPDLDLAAGTRVLKVRFPTGQVNLRALTLTALDPMALAPRSRQQAAPVTLFRVTPTGNGLTLAYASDVSRPASVEVTDSRGMRLGRWPVTLASGQGELRLPGFAPGKGLHVVTLTAGPDLRLRRLVLR